MNERERRNKMTIELSSECAPGAFPWTKSSTRSIVRHYPTFAILYQFPKMGSKGFYSLTFHSTTGKQAALSWSPDNRIALACETGVYVLVIKTSPTDFTASFVIHKECIEAEQVRLCSNYRHYHLSSTSSSSLLSLSSKHCHRQQTLAHHLSFARNASTRWLRRW